MPDVIKPQIINISKHFDAGMCYFRFQILLYVLKVFLLINYLLSLDEADYLDNVYIYIDNLGYKGQQSASSQEISLEVLEALF